MISEGMLDLCTNKLWGEFFELDSPCVIELFSGMESEAKNALFAIESECTLLKGVTKPYLSIQWVYHCNE